ncbi:unnamed protein product [Protopolystoma xenopodis]|uniref:Uncharacterized protein n=1 Tax=Protopolystoma xenopodis TaxID=117903 RepID=A0A3S5B830_9PLAT|nr:unnamed protein product [Protopolystoma xenopodis]
MEIVQQAALLVCECGKPINTSAICCWVDHNPKEPPFQLAAYSSVLIECKIFSSHPRREE